MRAGEIAFKLGQTVFTGRLTLGALSELQRRTGCHPIQLVTQFEAMTDTPDHARDVLVCSVAGMGMPIGLAEQSIDAAIDTECVGYADMRLDACRLLNAGLFTPRLKDRKPVKKLLPVETIRRICSGFFSWVTILAGRLTWWRA